MKFDPISEMRNKYLADNDGNVSDREAYDAYEKWTNERLAKGTAYNRGRVHTLESFAKATGEILDPTWSQYTYEEIIQMEDTGVNIPKAVKNWAHSMQDTDATNYEIVDNGTEENNKEGDSTNEENPFLELLGKAKTNVKGCYEKNDQINESLEKFEPLAKESKGLKEKIEDSQKSALQKIQEVVEEWKALKAKNDKGETLTKSEKERFEKLGKAFNQKNSAYKSEMLDNSIDFNRLSKTIQELSMTTEETSLLGGETLDIGLTLSDYESKSKFKNTKQAVGQAIGVFGAMMVMATGKKVAEEATKVGGDTQEYSNDIQVTMNEIATIMDLATTGNQAKPKTKGQENGSIEPPIATTPETTDKNEDDKTDKTKEDNKNEAYKVAQNTQNLTTRSGASGQPTPAPTVENKDSGNTKPSGKKNESSSDEIKNIDNASDGKKAAGEAGTQQKDVRQKTADTEKDTKEVNKDNKNAIKLGAKTKKEEKSFEAKIKANQILVQENSKKIQKAAEEINKSEEEILTMQAEIEVLAASSASNQNTMPAPAPRGMLQNQQNQQSVYAQKGAAGGNNNAGRIEELQGRISAKSVTMTNNGKQIYVLQKSSTRAVKNMNKMSQAIVKTNKVNQKNLETEETNAQKVIKVAEKIDEISGMVAKVGKLVTYAGKGLVLLGASLTWAAGAGAALIATGQVMQKVGTVTELVGNYGQAAANITKAAAYAADGNLLGAITSAGSAIMSGAAAIKGTKELSKTMGAIDDQGKAATEKLKEKVAEKTKDLKPNVGNTLTADSASAPKIDQGSNMMTSTTVDGNPVNTPGANSMAQAQGPNMMTSTTVDGNPVNTPGAGSMAQAQGPNMMTSTTIDGNPVNTPGAGSMAQAQGPNMKTFSNTGAQPISPSQAIQPTDMGKITADAKKSMEVLGKQVSEKQMKDYAKKALMKKMKDEFISGAGALGTDAMNFVQNKYGQEQPQAEEGKEAAFVPYKMSQRFRNIKKKNNKQKVAMASTTDRHSNGNQKRQ